MKMTLTIVSSNSQLDGILTKAPNKLSVIDFHATWCGPCHMIAPTFEALSKQYTNVNFLKCDVDDARDVATRFQVAAMPTFIFLKGSTKVDQVRGANKAALESTIQKHASSTAIGAEPFVGKGNTLGSGSSAATPKPARPNGILSDIYAYYSGLDPQLKLLIWVLAAYFIFMKLA